MNFTFQTDQIQIFVGTSIDKSKSQSVTKLLLGMGNSTNNPYFTGWYKYDKDLLIRKKYKDRVDFFFDEEIFISTFKGKEKSIDADTHIDYNVNVMIEILFPTIYPVKNDNTTSFNNIMKISNNIFSLRGIPFISSFNDMFSYIHINSHIYTVTSTCLLNDFINHPLYSKLIPDFLLFDNWRNNTKNVIKMKLHKLKTNINSIIDKEYGDESQIKDEINGSYIRETLHKVQKDNYISALSLLFKNQLLISMHDDCSKSLKSIERKIKDNVFSVNVRFSSLTKYIKEFLDLSTTNDFFFLFKYDLSMMNSTTERYIDINFKEYKVFYEKVAQFDSYHRFTLNKPIQKIINDYVEKKNFNLEQYLFFINDRYVKKRNHHVFPQILRSYQMGNEKESIFLGVTKYNYISQVNSNYEAHIHLNLILGKFDESHLSKITCDYKNEILGNAFLGINSSSNQIKEPIIDLKTMIKSEDRNKNVKGGKRRRSLKRKIKKLSFKKKTKKRR